MAVAVATKKYTPKVRELIRLMQFGHKLSKGMGLHTENYTTGVRNYRAYYNLRGEISEKAYDALMATKGDLIQLSPGQEGKGYMDEFTFELTERGKSIQWDNKGNEMPADYVPAKDKSTKRTYPQQFLIPSLNLIVESKDIEESNFCMSGMGEPGLQIPFIPKEEREQKENAPEYLYASKLMEDAGYTRLSDRLNKIPTSVIQHAAKSMVSEVYETLKDGEIILMRRYVHLDYDGNLNIGRHGKGNLIGYVENVTRLVDGKAVFYFYWEAYVPANFANTYETTFQESIGK